ncbi:MAG: EAL domain-containing protein [Aquaspirillum sp.]
MISPQHILIVDHQISRCVLLTERLRTRGVRAVRRVPSIEMALQALDQDVTDLVFCAVDLPQLAGIALLRALAARPSNPTLVLYGELDPALLATADRMAEALGLKTLGWSGTPADDAVLDALFTRIHNDDMPEPPAVVPPETIDDIVRGIANNEFESFFQPILDLKNNRVVGVEALARWRHREKGLIHPASFIPVLERFDMMDAITGIMVDRAAAACRRWLDDGIRLSVAINLSAVSLSDTELADELAARVLRHGVPPARFVFEFSETGINAHPADALENVLRLRMHGFGLAIDDFGVGGASLKQLSALPFTQLKIDRAFVHGAAGDPTLSSILETGLSLARRLGLEAVAEGVEREADMELLRQLGCDRVQGYASGEALPEAEFLAWLKARGEA